MKGAACHKTNLYFNNTQAIINCTAGGARVLKDANLPIFANGGSYGHMCSRVCMLRPCIKVQTLYTKVQTAAGGIIPDLGCLTNHLIFCNNTAFEK